jgi:hypothetical protein
MSARTSNTPREWARPIPSTRSPFPQLLHKHDHQHDSCGCSNLSIPLSSSTPYHGLRLFFPFSPVLCLHSRFHLLAVATASAGEGSTKEATDKSEKVQMLQRRVLVGMAIGMPPLPLSPQQVIKAQRRPPRTCLTPFTPSQLLSPTRITTPPSCGSAHTRCHEAPSPIRSRLIPRLRHHGEGRMEVCQEAL